MLVSQNYAQRSSASLEGNSFRLSMATERSRPPVQLHATIADGLSYARLMKTLYALVCGDQRTPQKDHTAYQAWVQQRYLDELDEQMARAQAQLPGLLQTRDRLNAEVKEAVQRVVRLQNIADGGSFEKSKRNYFNYLYKYDFDGWMVLDPVVSVHPDCLIFEAFSKDESSYGRVTVPMSGLDLHGPVDYGTTNIDFSPDLAREISRIRSYRPTDLDVSAGAVGLSTDAGAVVEKKIDLPPTWVRGFLQVQSAATLPGTQVRLSAATVADMLTVFKRQREDRGPRSLRLVLTPGRKPTILVEPWNVTITEHEHVYKGKTPQEIRLWGRRRLLVLEGLLPYATRIELRLMGTGLPSYWTVFQNDLRIDMGLSGWTQNDWSRAAQFDLLASTAQASAEQVGSVSRVLEGRLVVKTEDVADVTGAAREIATAALQQLCREGRAMYDHVTGTYRWRQLFPFMPEPQATEGDPRLKAARRIVERNGVTWLGQPQKRAAQAELVKPQAASWREFEFRDPKSNSNKFWAIKLEGEAFTVRFGRIGTSGQEQTKEYESKSAARDEHDKMIREKLRKSYVETTTAPIAAAPAADTGETPSTSETVTRYQAQVKSEKTFQVTIDLDADGRVVYAECTCGDFKRDKLRKGPCPHILATTVLAARQQMAAMSQEVANV